MFRLMSIPKESLGNKEKMLFISGEQGNKGFWCEQGNTKNIDGKHALIFGEQKHVPISFMGKWE